MGKKDKKAKHEAGADNSAVQQDNQQVGGVDGSTKSKGSSAPRARKHDYGIKPEATVVRLVEVANVKRDIQAQFAHTEGEPTVAQFYERGGDRHGLRVMSRRKLIQIVHKDADGNVVDTFPKAYVKPEKAAEAAAQ